MAMTWRPPDDLYEALRVIAFHTRRSITDLLNEAARDFVENKGKQLAKEAATRKGKH